jgi:hypothetical protein
MADARASNDAPQARAVPRIELTPADAGTQQLWESTLDLVDELHAELDGHWTLVGGLMVQLHVTRYGNGSARVTDDIDLLGDSRKRPSATERIAELLESLKFTLDAPAGLGMETAFRFTRGNEIVDVLGPDGMKHQPKTVGQFETIQVKGGTQALNRTESVPVVLRGREAAVRVPNLAGAILLKARAITSPLRVQDREDLIRLLLCVEDPRAIAAEMQKSERRWLREAGKHLRLEDDLPAIFPGDQLARARVTYRLLLQDA